MLHHHPRIAIPYESGFLTQYFERRAEYGDLRDDANCRRLVRAMLAEPTLRMWDHSFDVDHIVTARQRSVAVSPTPCFGLQRRGAALGDVGLPRRLHLIHECFPTRNSFTSSATVGCGQFRPQLPWGPDTSYEPRSGGRARLVGRRVGDLGRRYLECATSVSSTTLSASCADAALSREDYSPLALVL